MRMMGVALIFAAFVSAQSPQKTPPANAFDERTASRLLLQLSESLQGHSQKQFLALFDLAKMKDGALFKQQVTSFFSHTESIRAHLNLIETSLSGEEASISVQAEMEAEPRNGGPVVRRNDRLDFAVVSEGASWKFAGLQPRGFFSLP